MWSERLTEVLEARPGGFSDETDPSCPELQEWPQTTRFAGFVWRKGFFGAWRLQSGTKRRYLHGLVRFPGTTAMTLSYARFKVATKHRQLHSGGGLCQQLQNTVNTSVFSSSSLEKWPQTTQWTGFSVAVRPKTSKKPMVFQVSRLQKCSKSTWCFEKCLGFSTWCFDLTLIL